MKITKEKPGAQTPWSSINKLLALDECFEIDDPNWKGFLLAPKHASKLAALIFLLQSENILFGFHEMGCPSFSTKHQIVVSSRAFSQLHFYESNVIEIGAGSTLLQVNQSLFERKQEMILEGNPLATQKQSIGELIISGKMGTLQLHQETFFNSFLGAELITQEGSRLVLGGKHRCIMPGSPLHQLLCGIEAIPGLLLNIRLKTFPIPAMRLRLAWNFQEEQNAWEQIEALKQFTSSWERLDCVTSGRSQEQIFVLAQISGSKEEMDAFKEFCPHYQTASQQNEYYRLQEFLRQKNLNIYLMKKKPTLQPGDYFWQQVMGTKNWWITSQSQKESILSEFPIWKQRMFAAFGVKDNPNG